MFRQYIFEVVRSEYRDAVHPLALLFGVIIQEGNDPEWVGARSLDRLLGDDARFSGTENDDGGGACRLEPLIDRAYRDSETDEQHGRGEEFDGGDTEWDGIGPPHGQRREVQREEQCGSHGQ